MNGLRIGIIFLLSLFSNTAAANDEQLYSAIHNFYSAGMDVQRNVALVASSVDGALQGEVHASDVKTHQNLLKESFKNWDAHRNQLLTQLELPQNKTREGLELFRSDATDPEEDKFVALIEALSVFAETSRHDTYAVYANEGWANSGLSVTTGDIISVNSSGAWTVSPNYSGADARGYVCERSTAYRINGETPLGALVYRVRGSSKQNGYPLNANGLGQADADGRLEFTINDSDLRNNSGQLSLEISIYNADAIEALQQAFTQAES